MNEQEILQRALEKADLAEREAYLDFTCGKDTELRRRIEKLLELKAGSGGSQPRPSGEGVIAEGDAGAAHPAASRPLGPALETTIDLPPTAEASPGPMDADPRVCARAGTRIRCVGDYELREEIGRGGMGIVYRAWDLRLGRDVAVKTVQESYRDQEAALSRFLAEARITGQLQHPGIPPVHELGELPDGRPFLAMKLVQGRTLAELLQQAWGRSAEGQLEPHELGRFVAIFEQLCHAVGYAHAHGVIHRDLKPSNVMVGGHGEVQVMDWGLAKVLGGVVGQPAQEPEPAPAVTAAPATAVETPLRGDSTTRTGSVLGTPSYMSPEQAAGELHKLDARSDVFGLGAVLCRILTGRPPYEGTDATEVWPKAVRAELQQAFARLDQCGAEPDLVALCKRCLAVRQEDRPADGSAVADEVARIRQAAEERARQAEIRAHRARILRRVAAGAVAAAVLMACLAAFSAVQWKRAERNERAANEERRRAVASEQQAIRERDRADRNATRARKAVENYLVRVTENRLLKQADFHDLRKQLLLAALPFYQAFVQERSDDPHLESERGKAHRYLGLLHSELGEHQQAISNHDQARQIFEKLAAEFAGVPEYRLELALSYNNLGNEFSQTGRPQEAEAAFRQAVAVGEKLLADFPDAAQYRQALAGSSYNLGNLLHEGRRLHEAEAAYQQALVLRKKLAAAFPAEPQYRQELAMTHNVLGMLFQDYNRVKESEAEYREALAIQEALVRDDPREPAYRGALSLTYNNLAYLLSHAGRHREAEAAYRKAWDLTEKLSRDFPTVPEYRLDLVIR
ncbi:MAG: hypothetical protein KatS3mg110_4497 [Pirellulaceae bacterium]|nr:MAG: hypothetical protein KatS3mg110_4497 [Pirellulaceae bacterium]